LYVDNKVEKGWKPRDIVVIPATPILNWIRQKRNRNARNAGKHISKNVALQIPRGDAIAPIT
jgi:hypothetical protein